MTTAGIILCALIALVTAAQIWACWGAVKAARTSDKVFAVAALLAAALAAYDGDAVLASLWMLVVSHDIYEARLKSRIRALGGEA